MENMPAIPCSSRSCTAKREKRVVAVFGCAVYRELSVVLVRKLAERDRSCALFWVVREEQARVRWSTKEWPRFKVQMGLQKQRVLKPSIYTRELNDGV